MSTSPIKLLIADDNHSMCNILYEFFRMSDQISICAVSYDGNDTLEKIYIHQPDVVLLDIIMPQLDGLSILERLNADPPQKRPSVIITSAIGLDTITARALHMGADYYLVKPYQLQSLLERVLMVAAEAKEQASEPPDPGISINAAVSRHLISLNMSTHIIGYRYCVQAIEMMLNEPAYCPLMKYVYPQIARKNETTAACVESAIRKAIGTVDSNELRKLSNRSFLSHMTEQIKIKYQL